jgi:hypothetical protein
MWEDPDLYLRVAESVIAVSPFLKKVIGNCLLKSTDSSLGPASVQRVAKGRIKLGIPASILYLSFL